MYIKIPTGPLAVDIVRGFERRWNFPQCFGAIDGSHKPIVAPTNSPTDYYNCKEFYSIVLQALVDHQYRFLNIYIGLPRSVHDALILSNSEVYHKGESGMLVPSHIRTFGRVPVPVVILGDPAYPLLPWLMKPYPLRETGCEASFDKPILNRFETILSAYVNVPTRFHVVM